MASDEDTSQEARMRTQQRPGRRLLDGTDIALLRKMYFDAPTIDEFREQKERAQRRLYTLSRLGLCRGDTAGMHPGQPRCWSLSPEGERVVEESEQDPWDEADYLYEYVRQEE
jgi:hypothetical protein